MSSIPDPVPQDRIPVAPHNHPTSETTPRDISTSALLCMQPMQLVPPVQQPDSHTYVVSPTLAQMALGDGCDWCCTFVYVHPAPVLKAELFLSLATLVGTISLPWLLTGPFDFRRCEHFQQWVNSCKLVDLGFCGPKFTWRGHESPAYGRAFERLDRAFGNLEWCSVFPSTTIRHLPCVRSDHHPILVCTDFLPRQLDDGKPFPFELAWTTHPDYPRLLSSHWDNSEALPHMLLRWQYRLREWNREILGLANQHP
ncbi:hypothetical protein K2173_024866 [Erythroxylum novogranatense]|uniref:Endonuclease/exonuclease/phosphatase domain-containing protein n=1 Tax=Erythroxylum novogranatense TaxID=1862640 RepID=A0AAV8UFE2_9ROSI|nr:hypothetical protein K2173_024866 [Erythroxylum novogranatense]